MHQGAESFHVSMGPVTRVCAGVAPQYIRRPNAQVRPSGAERLAATLGSRLVDGKPIAGNNPAAA